MADADAQRQAATMITSIINRTQALWKAVLVQHMHLGRVLWSDAVVAAAIATRSFP